jgi:hypothetical protein
MNIYLAGMEQLDGWPFIQRGDIINAFVSYYYVRKKGNSKRMAVMRQKIKRIIIDSGAHSFFAETSQALSASVVVKKHKTKESPEQFFKEYKEWLHEYWDCFDYFVELDIGEIVGQKRVLEWREELKKEGLFKKCITVVHPKIVSWDDFLQMLDDSESKYIAIEGDRPNRERLPYNKYLKVAYERGIKVHGFAMTKVDAMDKYPFTSVDSTSWKAGAQYGCTKVITKKGLKNVRFTDKKACMNISDISHKVFSKDLAENRFHRYILSIHAYQKMEEYYTKFWKAKGISWKN